MDVLLTCNVDEHDAKYIFLLKQTNIGQFRCFN